MNALKIPLINLYNRAKTAGLRYFPILILFSTSLIVKSQDTTLLQSWGGVNYRINAVGGLGTESFSAVEYPPGSGHFPLRRLNFWVTGIKNNSDTFAVASDIFSKKSNWAIGPLGTSVPAHVSPLQWPHFLQVSQSQIAAHKSQYLNSGYIAPVGISRWPAAFNLPGFPVVCAPFLDLDQNGKYNPKEGDYPYLPGKNHVFAMGSDSAAMSNLKTHQTGFDLASIWFEPTATDSIPNTSYFRLILCNRTKDTFTQVKLSLLADFKIGNPIDDQLATHVKYNSIYGYNQQGGDSEYGNNWPSVAVGWLSKKASASIYLYADNSIVQGNPATEVEFFNYANGLWRSGKNMGSSGSGLDASTSQSKFIYPGTTNPALPLGRNWTNKEGNAGRQTALISTEPLTFNGAGCKVLDGYISIIPNAPDSAAMEKRFAAIDKHYNSQEFTLGKSNKFLEKNSWFYPNPVISNGNIYFHSNLPQSIAIYDLQGKLLLEKNNVIGEMKIELKPGNYVIKTAEKTARFLQVY